MQFKKLYLWKYLSAILCACIVIECKQTIHAEYEIVEKTSVNKNIIKNGNFEEGLKHWTIPTIGIGEYVTVIKEGTSSQNHVMSIHSLDATINVPGRFYIASVSQTFIIHSGDFQHVDIRAKVKSDGGAIPSLLIVFYNHDKESDENANYGKLEQVSKIDDSQPNEWRTLQFSAKIPQQANSFVIWCTGSNYQDPTSIHASEVFEIYYDDVEVLLQ